MRNIFTVLIALVFLNSVLLSQKVEQTSEPQTISGGAEYSIYLQNLINSNQAAELKI